MKFWSAFRSIGRYQWILLMIQSIVTITFWTNSGIVVFAPELDFTCLNFNSTGSQCVGNNVSSSYADFLVSENETRETYYGMSDNVNATRRCSSFEYDHSQFDWTLTERFNLVCDREYLVTILKSIWIAGQLFSSITGGMLSDIIGRKRLVLITSIAAIIGHVLSALIGNVWIYIAVRFVLACTVMYAYVGLLILLLEGITKEQRLAAKFIDSGAENITVMLNIAAYYVSSNYVHAHIIQIIVWLMIMICTLFFTYESPRWLRAKKQDELAIENVRKISKINKVSFEKLDHLLMRNETTTGSVMDLFRTPLIRKRTIIQMIVWSSYVLAYYAITLNLGDFTEDVRISFLISGAIQLGSNFAFFFLMNKFGRPLLIFVMMVGGGICCLSMAPIIEDKSHPALIMLALIGKLLMANMFFAMYLYTPEVYPTVIRGTGLGACSTVSRMLTVLAPQIRLLNDFWAPSMVVTIGAIAVLSGFLVPLLPDMTNVEMPQTIEDGENLFRDHRYSLRKAVTKTKESNDLKKDIIPLNETA